MALSGGGSRAAAFHRGTVRGLIDLGLIDRVDVVSTVSGGSVFGGAWMAARSDNVADADFLKMMERELSAGFIARSIRPRIVKLIFPRYSRTNLIAETLDEIFFHGKTLGDLPSRPQLCINTTILNNGQVGKFSGDGFSARDVHLSGQASEHHIPLPDFPLSLAVSASAAFPVGLPPLKISRRTFPKGVEFTESLKGARSLALSDGGVLENLGTQTLVKGRRFGTWDLVVSDAGTKGKPWNPDSFFNRFRSPLVGVLSGSSLDRVMLVMNDKENRWARQQIMGEVQASWIANALRHGRSDPGLARMLKDWRSLPRRNVLFVRVAQTWNSFMESISAHRLVELAALSGNGGLSVPDSRNAAAVEQFLGDVGVSLSVAEDYYKQLGGDAGATAANRVATNFTGLSKRVLTQLAAHAAWQVHATNAVYGI